MLTDGQRLAEIGKSYQSRTILITPNAEAQRLVLPRDPRRFYIEFRGYNLSTMPKVYAGEIPSGATSGVTETGPRSYKAKDSPGLVTGEWYILTTDALQILEIVTDTYIGR